MKVHLPQSSYGSLRDDKYCCHGEPYGSLRDDNYLLMGVQTGNYRMPLMVFKS